MNCSLDELKKLMSAMTFGDWELFRMAVLSLREREFNPQRDPSPIPNGAALYQPAAHAHSNLLDVDFESGRMSRSSSLRSTHFPTTANGS